MQLSDKLHAARCSQKIQDVL